MSEFGDKLNEALSKKNNVENYIWKDKKENGQQVEHRLIDFDQKTLQDKFNLCEQMLYNQMLRCRAELLVRWIRNAHECTSIMLLESIRTLLSKNKGELPADYIKTAAIGEIISGIDDLDYRKVPINLVMNACMDYLGIMDTSHLTFNFVLRMGLWFTQQEMQTPVEEGGLYQKDPNTGKAVNRLELV